MSIFDKLQSLEMMNPNQPQNAGQYAHPMAGQIPPTLAPRNPLEAGAESGINATRRSLEGDAEDDARHQQRMMSLFFSNLYNTPRPDFGLSGFARSLNGVSQYSQGEANNERQRIKDENMALLLRQDKLRQNAEDRDFKKAELAETKRYHNILSENYNQKNKKDSGSGIQSVSRIEQLKNEGVIPNSAIPLATLPKNVQLAYHKDMQAKANAGKSYKNVINTLNEMQKISDEHPDLDTDFNQILLNSGSGKESGLLNVIKRKYTDKNSQAAIEKFNKLNSNLIENKIKGLPGNKGTDRMKSIIQDGVPKFGQTKAARDYVMQQMKKEYEPMLKESVWSSRGISGSYYVPPSNEEYEDEQMVNNGADTQGASNGYQISPQDIEAAKRAHPELAGFTDEEIAEGMRIDKQGSGGG